jgi:hypothetical protein
MKITTHIKAGKLATNHQAVMVRIRTRPGR